MPHTNTTEAPQNEPAPYRGKRFLGRPPRTYTGTVLLTVTSTAAPATDLGFLLHKHPDRVQEFSTSVGTATVFYPEATEQRCTVALLLAVDPVGLVRGKKSKPAGFALAQYVNDRPYAASSMLAVALGRVFSTALKGRCDAKPELVECDLPLQIDIPALPARRGTGNVGGPDLVRALFEPLGWAVETTTRPLVADMDWGDAPYVTVTLTGTMTLSKALRQLYVLLPVLDDAKHYWVTNDEVDKLVRQGTDWLGDHPHRDLIAARYVAASRPLVRDALVRLAELDDRVPDPPDTPNGSTSDGIDSGNNPSQECSPDGSGSESRAVSQPEDVSPEAPPRVRLKYQRRDAVLQVLEQAGARRVVDAGCGEGFYLQALLERPQFTQVVGVDVSAGELERAEKRLQLDRMPDGQRSRLELRQSSLTYRDEKLAGFDALLLVEVIEHVEADRVATVAANVFGAAAPTTVVVTTPNVEHNEQYGLAPGELRHPDHRFEWTRAEFGDWGTTIAAQYGYSVEFRPIGTADPGVGPPTQMAIFSQTGTAVQSSTGQQLTDSR